MLSETAVRHTRDTQKNDVLRHLRLQRGITGTIYQIFEGAAPPQWRIDHNLDIEIRPNAQRNVYEKHAYTPTFSTISCVQPFKESVYILDMIDWYDNQGAGREEDI